LDGAPQIAAIQGAKPLPRQTLSQGFGLRNSFARQTTVEMTLPNFRNIPFGLPVADDDKLRALHEPAYSHSRWNKVNYQRRRKILFVVCARNPIATSS
jgi:hypothetical protein